MGSKMKPNFVRQNISRKRLRVKWRRPRGIHSKLRLNKAGHIKKPSQGFRAPRKERIPSTTFIEGIKDLVNAKPSILLSSKLGLKKKLEILKRAGELKLNVLNIKNIDEFISKANESMEKKRQEKKKRRTDKKKSKEKAVKETEKKKQEEKKSEPEKHQEESKGESRQG
ncbi:hypothetical protein J4443_01245 [Candidatus Woesearchaeota archaeon]|nr:hypothetical protein [Candidatus Woesearchaeota archaeon]